MGRKTIASLEAELNRKSEQIAELIGQRDDARLDARITDSESKALAGCVASIDAIEYRVDSWTAHNQPRPDQVRRILRFLADRYGVEWVDIADADRLPAA